MVNTIFLCILVTLHIFLFKIYCQTSKFINNLYNVIISVACGVQ